MATPSVPAVAGQRFVERPGCPVCGGPGGAEVAGEVWEGTAIRIVRCRACGCGYSTPVPTLEYRRAYYRRWSADDPRTTFGVHFGLQQQPRHAALYRRGLRAIADAGVRGSLLDVGCAGGMALLFAQDFEGVAEGGRWHSRFQAEGLAATDEEQRQASSVTGCPVHRIEDLPSLEAGRYAAITAFNTLEHVHDAPALLSGLRRVLAPDGALYLVVPNNAFLFVRLGLGIGPVPGLEPFEHLNHFTPRSVCGLLRRTGFRRVRLMHDSPAGPQGFFHRRRAGDLVKWSAFFASAVLSGRRVYWYPQILALARP